MAKTIIVGDIHGCFAELEALLEKTGFSEDEDTLIFLGDLIDRGKEPFLVVQKALELRDKMGERFVCLMGNHEDLCLEAVINRDFGLWYANGGNKTQRDFVYRHGKSPSDYIGFFRSLPLYYETEQFVCVHAGLHGKKPEETRRDIFLWGRDLAERYYLYDGKFLIYGHTPVKQVELALPLLNEKELCSRLEYVPMVCGRPYPLPKRGSVDLDTGCVFGGKLSALTIENDTIKLFQALSMKRS